MAGAALRHILGDSRSVKCCIFQYKTVAKIGPGRSPKQRVRDDDFIFGYLRIYSEYVRIIVFLLAEAMQGFCAEIMNSEFRGRRSIW